MNELDIGFKEVNNHVNQLPKWMRDFIRGQVTHTKRRLNNEKTTQTLR